MLTFDHHFKDNKYMKAQLIKELKEMAKANAGYVSISNFIKDFNLGSTASVSEPHWHAETWTLTIKKGHKYEYFTFIN